MNFLVVLFLSVFINTAWSIDCDYVETHGNTMQSQIKSDLNREIGNKSYRIDGMQKLYIKKVKSVKFSNCNVDVWIGLKIKRQVFGNASGKLLMEGQVVELTPDKICLDEIKVTKLKLNNSSGTARKVYKALLNEALPNKECFVLR